VVGEERLFLLTESLKSAMVGRESLIEQLSNSAMARTKLITIILMVIGIVLLPSSLRAPSTDGLVSAQPTTETTSIQLQPSSKPTDSAVYTVRTVYTVPNLQLKVPFNMESRWSSGDESWQGIWWNTNDGEKYFSIQDGQFVSTNPTDTWFIYGWFGPLTAIKEDYNIKYPQWQDRHNGIDFAGKEGIAVTSASDGVIIFAGNQIGNTVIIQTGDYQITYGHLQNISVKIGQPITAGDLIGHLGSTGTTNPHLHFQVDYINKTNHIAINPVPLINTNWDKVIIPGAPSNSFYSGPTDPALQPNFAW